LQLLRALDDGGLSSAEYFDLANAATERFPEFAAFWLHRGDSKRTLDKAAAENAYRDGLRHAEEPDIESRLLCALAGMLPSDSNERSQLVRRAESLDGSLMALAVAQLLNVG
jgi:hypothetical protein